MKSRLLKSGSDRSWEDWGGWEDRALDSEKNDGWLQNGVKVTRFLVEVLINHIRLGWFSSGLVNHELAGNSSPRGAGNQVPDFLVFLWEKFFKGNSLQSDDHNQGHEFQHPWMKRSFDNRPRSQWFSNQSNLSSNQDAYINHSHIFLTWTIGNVPFDEKFKGFHEPNSRLSLHILSN